MNLSFGEILTWEMRNKIFQLKVWLPDCVCEQLNRLVLGISLKNRSSSVWRIWTLRALDQEDYGPGGLWALGSLVPPVVPLMLPHGGNASDGELNPPQKLLQWQKEEKGAENFSREEKIERKTETEMENGV